MNISNVPRKIFKIRTFSPLGFLSWATLVTVVFAVCHLAGLREYTTFISGTAVEANGGASLNWGMVYLVSYFAFVLVMPILILAAGIFAGLSALTKSSSKSHEL